MKARLGIIGLLLAILVGLGLLFGFILPQLARLQPRGPRTYTTAAVLKQVQTLSQLVTVKYVLEKVIVVEDAKWYGESRVILVAHGVVKAGVDLSRLRPEDVQAGPGRVRVTLPAAVITDAYLDEDKTTVVERTTGVLRLFDKDLEQNARRDALEELRRGARASGILKEANERAREQLKVLFQQMGVEQVEILAP